MQITIDSRYNTLQSIYSDFEYLVQDSNGEEVNTWDTFGDRTSQWRNCTCRQRTGYRAYSEDEHCVV